MDLWIEADALARFFDPAPKVLVPSGDPLADALPDEADPPLFEVWVVAPDGASGVVRPRGADGPGGRLIPVPNPPAGACVLAAGTAEGAAALDPLRVWWAETGPRPVPVARCRDGADAGAEILRVFLREA